MRDLVKVALSDSGTELFVYDGNDNLLCIKGVADAQEVVDYVAAEIETSLTEDKEDA